MFKEELCNWLELVYKKKERAQARAIFYFYFSYIQAEKHLLSRYHHNIKVGSSNNFWKEKIIDLSFPFLDFHSWNEDESHKMMHWVITHNSFK